MDRIYSDQDTLEFYNAGQELRKFGLDLEQEGAVHNMNAIGGYFHANPTVPVTVATIKAFVEAHKDELIFRTSTQREYDQLYVRFTQAGYNETHRDLIAVFLKNRGLKVNGDNLLHNWNLMVRWCLDKNQPVNQQNMDKVLGNLLNSPQGQYLRFEPRKPTKDWDAVRNEPSKPEQGTPTFTSAGDHPDSWVKPLEGHLKAHQEMLARPSQTVEATRRTDPDAEFRERAEGLVRSIQSNVDRAEAEQILKRAGAWGWQLTLRSIERFIDRRKLERSMAGRMG
jgi:hypothetical protein